VISYYICTDVALSDQFRLVPLGTGRNWLDSEPVEPTGSTGSDQNPVGKIGEISYCLAYTVIKNFWSESNRFQPVLIGTCGAQQRPHCSVLLLSPRLVPYLPRKVLSATRSCQNSHPETSVRMTTVPRKNRQHWSSAGGQKSLNSKNSQISFKTYFTMGLQRQSKMSSSTRHGQKKTCEISMVKHFSSTSVTMKSG